MFQAELYLSVLVLDNDVEEVARLVGELQNAGIGVRENHVEEEASFAAALEAKPDLILARDGLHPFDARAALRLMAGRGVSIPLVVIAGAWADGAARECSELGAADFISKDRRARLAATVMRVYLESKARVEKTEGLSNYRRMAAVAEATPDLVGMVDREGRITYINRAGREMIGVAADADLADVCIWNFVSDRMLPRIKKAVATALASGSWSGEVVFRGPDGVEFPVSQVIIAHREESNFYFSTVVRDISERIRAEVKLRESQSHFAAVWRYAKEAMRLTTREGLIQAVNERYCRLVGMTEEELVGQPFTVAYPESEADDNALRALHRKRFDEGIPLIEQERRTRFAKRDTEIDVELSMSLIVIEGGEDLLLTMVRDISEKKELEARFLRSQRMECIGALAGGIAHDFNNILAPIFMATAMLRMEIPAGDREKALGTIESSGQRGADIVRRLLLFARGIEGEKKLIQPADLFLDVAAIVERGFPRSVKLEEHVELDLWAVNGDPTQLHQVLLNLCLNARDAMPEGGTLRFEARNQVLDSYDLPASSDAKSGSFVVVTIADTGVGIAEEHLEQIFAPFFTTKAEGLGTGLGLSTSQGIIKSHGGFTCVSSALGEGTRFEVYLPAVTNAREEKEVSEKTPRDRKEGSDELILLVDDEPLVLELMGKVLGRCGYRTLQARSGKEGLVQLAERGNEIGAVVTDLIMPEMDGLQFMKRIRGDLPQLPILAMSGNFDQHVLNELVEIGVGETINKPFGANQLLTAVRAVLDPEKAKAGARP